MASTDSCDANTVPTSGVYTVRGCGPDDDHVDSTGNQHCQSKFMRKNEVPWRHTNGVEEKALFDDRELLFPVSDGRLLMPGLANLDTQLKVANGLIMSVRYAKEIGRYQDISEDFDDPYLRSISGHVTPVIGLLRNVPFRLKGASVTFYRDFWICDTIDSVVDIMIGASFIAENFTLLFDTFQSGCSTFAGWFSTRKETPEENVLREKRERQQRLEAIKREKARLEREQTSLEATQRQSQQQTGAQDSEPTATMRSGAASETRPH